MIPAKLAWIATFGALGVLSRYGVAALAARSTASEFPYSTLAINILGAFAIGILYVLGTEQSAISENARDGLLVGYLGGFTTFSSFALESLRLLETGHLAYCALYVTLSNGLGLAAAWGGIALTRLFFN